MASRRPYHPRLGIARIARGVLIFASLVVVLVTLLAFYKIEVPTRLVSEDVGKQANGALQQLNLICNGGNCSIRDEGTIREASDSSSSVTSSSRISLVSEEENLIHEQEKQTSKDGDLPLEEAVPEELVPDQESPALLTQLKPNNPNTTTPTIISSNINKVEQKDIEQSEAVPENEQEQLRPDLPAVQASISKKEIEKKAIIPKEKAPVKIRVKTIASVSGKSMSRISSISKSPVQEMPENPPILTKLLYEPGHSIKALDVCPNQGTGLKLLVLVTTAITHAAAREAVRNTWGHVAMRKDVGLAFFAGKSENATHNQLLAAESNLYGDIIQGNFLDSYNNLTLKTISMLEWVNTYCPQAKYFLKTDDDMYINFPQLFSILDKKEHKRTIMGKLARKWKPVRNTTSKYYMPPRLFGAKVYPDFNTGPAYVITSDIVGELYNKSLDSIFFKLEDVYVTGMIASRMRVSHVNYAEFINRRVKLDTCLVKKAVSIHMVKPHEMYDLWKRVSDGLAKCK